MFDTIVAPITGAPPAAVAWIRLSGPEAWAIAAGVFSPWPTEVIPQRASYGKWTHGDDGLCLPFAAGHSYTGESCVEISLHGSRSSLQQAVECCLAQGARLARPGEFTERAFLNGRIDLTQAEAVRETIDALTDAQLQEANRNREGALRQAIQRIRDELIGLRAAVEASVDFGEEIGPLDTDRAATILNQALQQAQTLLATSTVGRILRHGLRIAIVGPPNAGKSSLLNALLGEPRAIVTDIPGTTRDYVEERVDFSGLPVVLIDTAGLRESQDPVESIGIQRSRAQAAGADLVWFVFDGTHAPPEIPHFGPPVLPIANKADLGSTFAGLRVSAQTRVGLEQLVESTAPYFDRPPGPTVSPRVAELLQTALDEIAQAQHHLKSGVPDDLLSVLLNSAIEALGEITGETASIDMVARVFHDFCIGK